MNNFYQKGITLIALVVTIVVLLILAGISIAMLTGENSIIVRAKEAKENTAKAELQELVDLVITEWNLLNNSGKTIGLEELLKSKVGKEFDSVEKDQENKIIIKKDKYQVILDGNKYTNDDNIDTAEEIYNEKKGVNSPKLGKGMELVKYDTTTKTWVKDITGEEYTYEIQSTNTENGGTSKWANAVVNKNGEESFFVWIPRFAYRIDTNTKNIDIKFIKETGNIATDGTKCKYISDNPTNNDYIIHPAFTDDINNGGWDKQISGIWIGKYETSRLDSNGINQGTSTNLKVQPGVTSFRFVTVGNMFTYSYNFAREIESHMLKNSEWGAVVYLTHSKYGRNGTKVKINDTSSYITGSNNNIEKSVLASSTGNVYGIYDLCGGAWEYVSSYYSGGNSLNNGESFTTTKISNKYSTAYTDIVIQNAYKKGDATYEIMGLQGTYGEFMKQATPFFIRGSSYNHGEGASIFNFLNYDGGQGSGYISFRLALINDL